MTKSVLKWPPGLLLPVLAAAVIGILPAIVGDARTTTGVPDLAPGVGTHASGSTKGNRLDAIALHPAQVEPGGKAAPPANSSRLAMLERMPRMIRNEIDAVFYKAAYRPLDALVSAVSAGEGFAWVSEPMAVARLGDARVVGFCTRHNAPEYVAALRNHLDLLLSSSAWDPDDSLLLLECLPASVNDELREIATLDDPSRRRERLLDLLRAHWPWPCEAYAEHLAEIVGRGVHLQGFGADLRRFLPAAHVSDRRRRPGEGRPPMAFKSHADFKADFAAVNVRAAGAASHWLDGSRQRRVMIDCGLLHWFGGQRSIRSELRRVSQRVLILTGFVTELEFALEARFPGRSVDAWCFFPGGLVRAPEPLPSSLR